MHAASQELVFCAPGYGGGVGGWRNRCGVIVGRGCGALSLSRSAESAGFGSALGESAAAPDHCDRADRARMMEPEEKVVEVRCGRRIFVCTSSVVCKDKGSRIYEMYAAAITDNPARRLITIRLDPPKVEYVGPIIRAIETESFDKLVNENDDIEDIISVARYLNVKSVLEYLEERKKENQEQAEEVADHNDIMLEDEEAIFIKLMQKINARKSDSGNLSTISTLLEINDSEINGRQHATGEGSGPLSMEAKLDLLDNKIKTLENQIEHAQNDENGQLSLRQRETLKVELQRLRYERDQAILVERHSDKELAYNLLVVGVTGTGKSSSLNTLLNKQACKVSGAQAQGTRGCNMQEGVISDKHFVSFIDTQGLGADTSVTDTELLSQIMMSTESVTRMKIINNILISFDTNTRATPATMANQLTLMELFGEIRQSCFLILTKWNTSAVQCEWNTPLRKWTRKWRRAQTVEEITEEPPSYQVMYEAYCEYILAAMNNDEDAGAFSKMGTFLAFFQARVLWMYNLDAVEIEDYEGGDLEPHIIYLYSFYRDKALQCLKQGSTQLAVEDLTFLKEDGDTLAKVAGRLIDSRDKKIEQLEKIGTDSNKRVAMGSVFTDMAKENCSKMGNAQYTVDHVTHMEQIADLAGFSTQQTAVGCNVM